MLQKVFNIYENEKKSVLFFTFLGFIWSIGAFTAIALSDGLFLEHVGAHLIPQTYFYIAFVLLIISSLTLHMLNTTGINIIYNIYLLIGIGFYLLIALFLWMGISSDWLWFSFKIFSNVFLIVITMCFWTFIDQYFGLQNAKRIYTLFGSSIFLGTACGGAIISLAIQVIQPLGIVCIVITSFILCLFWINFTSHQLQPVADDAYEGALPSKKISLKLLIKTILSSRFTLYFLIGNLLVHILVVVTEYYFMHLFETHFTSVTTTSDNQLTSFLGGLYLWVSIGNIVFGILCYSRLVKKLGLNNLILIVPLCFVFIFSGKFLSGTLFLGITGFITVEGFLSCIDDPNFNLLLNAVPAKLKSKIRATLDLFFAPIGMLIGSTLLLSFQIPSKTLGLWLSIALVCVILLLRSSYSKGLLYNLFEHAIHFNQSFQRRLKQMSKKEQRCNYQSLLSLLNHQDDSASLFAIKALLQSGDASLLPALIKSLDQLSLTAKQSILPSLEKCHFFNEELPVYHLKKWANEEPSLTSKILFYLAKQGVLKPDNALPDLMSSDLNLKGATILALLKTASPQTDDYQLALVELNNLLHSSITPEVCMGLHILELEAQHEHTSLILPLITNPSLTIKQAAMQALSKTIDPHTQDYTPLILEELKKNSDHKLRTYCLNVLEKVGSTAIVRDIILASKHFRPSERRLAQSIIIRIGIRSLPVLLTLTKNKTICHSCRILAGRTLGILAPSELKRHLLSLIDLEIECAYLYFYHSHTIQKRYPQYDLHLLENALMTNYYSIIDFIIEILSAAGSIATSELLSKSLHSNNTKVHSHAVEVLEKNCEAKIFHLLQPLIDERPKKEVLKLYLKSARPILALEQLLDEIEKSSFTTNHIIAATLKARLNLPDWRAELRNQMKINEGVFNSFADELLEQC